MTRTGCTNAQNSAKLKELGAGPKTADLSRRHGAPESKLHSSMVTSGGLDMPGAGRLKALEDENVRLKMLLSEPMLSAEQIEAKFGAQYYTYQYHFVEFLTAHLADCSRAFEGDLQCMLVLAVIGQIHLQAMVAQKQNPDPTAQIVRDKKITASRLADATGIPRETVRRKLGKLEKLRWVEQESSGSWRLIIDEQRSRAQRDLTELDKRAMVRIAIFYHKLQSVLKT